MSDLRTELEAMGARARSAYSVLSQLPHADRKRGLHAMARAIRSAAPAILTANAADIAQAEKNHLSDAMRDRLLLNSARIESIARGIEEAAMQPDPLGRTLDAWQVAHNGLHIEKRSIPIGVLAIIYESRPNVTADVAALCFLSGNACILRGGSESSASSRAILQAIHTALREENLPLDAVQMVATQDRESVSHLLQMVGVIDLVIPRGGQSLTEKVATESRVPTLLHLTGNCHSYIHESAVLPEALRVLHNAKLRRTGVCGATESLLIDRRIAAKFLPKITDDLLAAGCELRGCNESTTIDARIAPASETDWSMEYLAPILSVKIVGNVQEAIAHINRYGSHHTDAILARDAAAIAAFEAGVDSAIVVVNASTQFADGGEFGFGGEVGIATGRLHARGPVGAAQLTTYKYCVRGTPEGTIRA